MGFLFGIPRSLQGDRVDTVPVGHSTATPLTAAPAPAATPGYGANTNLEQISDWLTKILVGVGLTQLTGLPSKLSEGAKYIGEALSGVGSTPEQLLTGERIASAMLLYFTTCGFLFSYLWTRLYLAGALAEADLAAQVARVEQKLDEQAKQAEIDARALSLVQRQFSADTSTPSVPEADLIEGIKNSSSSIKAQVFYQAEKLRRDSWQDDKPLMERTIPIFRALVAGDTGGRYHANYGQLGFALKDQREPRWAEAEAALNRAIRIRNSTEAVNSWPWYEGVRAICRINLDPAVKKQERTDDDRRKQIIEDLRVIRSAEPEWTSQSPIREWLVLNKVAEDELKSPWD
jgi:hypothetical protein